jgi:hypothetical protein
MRCHTAKRTALRPLTHMQESLHGSETSSSRTVTAIRYASGGIPEEEPGKTAELVSFVLIHVSQIMLTRSTEAAIDANAPLEEEDDPNGGVVDSDEETAAVMAALSHWNPQPVVPQPIFAPIKREYQLARLHEQLQTATNGGRLNIFKVVGYGAQKLSEGHPGLYEALEDAPGEPDPAVMGPFSRRSSSYSVAGAPPAQMRPSISSRA